MRKKINLKFFDKKDKPSQFDVFTIINAMIFFGVMALFIISLCTKCIEWVESTDKTDMFMPILQRVLAIVVTLIPLVIKWIFKFEFTKATTSCFYLFMFLTAYLGTFNGYYATLPVWDMITHFFSSVALGFLAMYFINHMQSKKRINIQLFYVFFIALCFSLTIGVLWEVYEYVFDAILNLNMQKYETVSGVVLNGKAVLFDTMTDLISNLGGAIFAGFACTLCAKKFSGFIPSFKITKINKQKNEQIDEIEE